MGKSHVNIEQKLCKVTRKLFNSKSLLMDEKLKPTFKKYITTGWSLSPEVQEKIDDGYVALIGVIVEKSTLDNSGQITLDGAYRTGQIYYIKKDVLKKLVPSLEINEIGFTESGFIKYLEDLNDNIE